MVEGRIFLFAVGIFISGAILVQIKKGQDRRKARVQTYARSRRHR